LEEKDGGKMNRAEEDYIKTIYELTIEKNQELIKTNDLVEHFGFRDQTVNEMVKRLENKGLVVFYPYKGLGLTDGGKKVAIRMIRAHRIWEVFLTEKLGFSWESVHADAEKLEHATSPEVLERLYAFLGKPGYCQHGNPIPDSTGKMLDAANTSLSSLEENDVFVLTRVRDSKDLLVYLNEQDISLGDAMTVIRKDAFNGLMRVRIKDRAIVVGLKTADMLFGVRRQG
jgi:DtxR family transcriptional regulator, Mn-dependent transcriptional regulator